jgi:hypothetical protein
MYTDGEAHSLFGGWGVLAPLRRPGVTRPPQLDSARYVVLLSRASV